MNRTANATEIGLKAPTSINPVIAVIAKPMSSATTTATMIRNDRNASHKMSRTTANVIAPLAAAPSFTVANSSFSIGTGPVSRTRAWNRPLRSRSAATARMVSVAAFPGSRAVKSNMGLIWISRRRSPGWTFALFN